MRDLSTNSEQEPLATLTPVGEPGGLTEIGIRSTVVEVGQGAGNGIVIDDDTVSTRHARIEYGEGGWMITDLGSRNGTFIDGALQAPGTPNPLGLEAELGFGAVRFRFRGRAVSGLREPPAGTVVPTGAGSRNRPKRRRIRVPLWLALLVLILALMLAYALRAAATVSVPDSLEPARPEESGAPIVARAA